jgi:transposase InsO family protein
MWTHGARRENEAGKEAAYSGTDHREAQILIERWRREYNAVRPHSSLGDQPPAPEAVDRDREIRDEQQC